LQLIYFNHRFIFQPSNSWIL